LAHAKDRLWAGCGLLGGRCDGALTELDAEVKDIDAFYDQLKEGYHHDRG